MFSPTSPSSLHAFTQAGAHQTFVASRLAWVGLGFDLASAETVGLKSPSTGLEENEQGAQLRCNISLCSGSLLASLVLATLGSDKRPRPFLHSIGCRLDPNVAFPLHLADRHRRGRSGNSRHSHLACEDKPLKTSLLGVFSFGLQCPNISRESGSKRPSVFPVDAGLKSLPPTPNEIHGRCFKSCWN